MATLALLGTRGRTIIQSLDARLTTIGRHAGNGVVIEDQSVSGKHASIQVRGAAFILYDHGSRNGTRVNGTKTSEIILNNGDRLQFGDTEAVFYSEESSNVADHLKASAPQNLPQQKNTLSAWCLALSIGSLVFSIFAAFPALLCGNAALKKIKASGGMQKGKGMAITGISIAFIYIMLVALALFDHASTLGTSQNTFLTHPSNAKGEVEKMILFSWQRDISNIPIQQIFESIHPAGKALSIKIDDVTVVQWKNATNRERYDDVVQFAVRMTLYWEGPATKDGFTKLNVLVDAESDRPVDMKILATNGITKGDVAEGIGSMLGLWLQYEAAKQGQENATRRYLQDSYHAPSRPLPSQSGPHRVRNPSAYGLPY